MEKEETTKIEIKKSPDEIIFHIDNYNDIFSDFDPRPYNKKALSDDFLFEAKKASLEKQEPIKLIFLVPVSERKIQDEVIIKRRLKEHFKKHSSLLEKEKKFKIKQGLFLFFLGIIIMALATFILSLKEKTFLFNFLIILLEPAGWFSFWEGLYILVFRIKEESANLKFYQKMSKSEIIFDSY